MVRCVQVQGKVTAEYGTRGIGDKSDNVSD